MKNQKWNPERFKILFERNSLQADILLLQGSLGHGLGLESTRMNQTGLAQDDSVLNNPANSSKTLHTVLIRIEHIF